MLWPNDVYRRGVQQGRIQEFALGSHIPSPVKSCPVPSHPLPSPPLLLRSRVPLNQLGGLEERCKLPSGVRGKAPAENEFGALKL